MGNCHFVLGGSCTDKAHKLAVMMVESANYEDKIIVRECSKT